MGEVQVGRLRLTLWRSTRTDVRVSRRYRANQTGNTPTVGEARFVRRTPLAFCSRSRVLCKSEAAVFEEESAVAMTAEAVECGGQGLETRGPLTGRRIF